MIAVLFILSDYVQYKVPNLIKDLFTIPNLSCSFQFFFFFRFPLVHICANQEQKQLVWMLVGNFLLFTAKRSQLPKGILHSLPQLKSCKMLLLSPHIPLLKMYILPLVLTSLPTHSSPFFLSFLTSLIPTPFFRSFPLRIPALGLSPHGSYHC